MPPQTTTLQPLAQTGPAPSPAVSSALSNNINPIAVNAAKAIRQVESGGNYTATSKDGSFGAYQFIKPTWDAAAKKYLGQPIPWQSATREQQNEVAVKQINDWIQSGKATNVGQIASMWNAGEGNPDAYLKGLKGTNTSGVNFDVGAYAKKVATAYQQIKGNPAPSDTTVQDQQPSIADQRAQLEAQGQPVSVNPDRAKPTFGGSLLRGLISPVVRAVNTPIEGIQKLLGKNPNEYNSYLGDVSGLGMKANQTPIQRIKDIAGGVANVAADFVGGEGAAGLADALGTGLIGKGALQGAYAGVKAGALQGLGGALQTDKGIGGTLAQTGIGALEGGAAGGVLGGAAGAIGKGSTVLLGKEPGSIANDQMDQSIAQTLGSGGKRTAGTLNRTIEQNRQGFTSLYDRGQGVEVTNLDGEKVPFNPTKATLSETIQAHSQVKSSIYNEYTKLAQETGDKGALVDISPIINDLQGTASTVGRRSTAIDKATNIADDLKRNFPKGKATPAQIQSFVEDLNQETAASFRSGNFNAKTDVAAGAAEKLRNAADETIQNATGKQYQSLRNEYGAVKSIESGLVKRFQQQTRKVGNGIPGYVDLAGNIDLLSSVLKSNPATFAKGSALKLIAKSLKTARDPEAMLQKTFQLIQKNKEGVPGLLGTVKTALSKKPKKTP